MKTIKKKTEKSNFTKKIESVETEELEDYLMSKKVKDIGKLLVEKGDAVIYDITNKNCSDYMKDLIKQKGFTFRKVISLAGMNESYGRQVLSGKKGISKRDTIIRICIASNFSVVETNRALKLYNMPVLYVKNKRDAVIMIAINEGENYFKIYGYVGGMPEVVQKFIDTKNFEIVINTQKEILKAYDLDFSKHASGEKLEKIRMVWNSIPMQLAKDNKKFKYSEIKKNSRAKYYENAIQFLKDAGLVYNIYNINKFNIPLDSYKDVTCFKMYMLDVGLLSNMNHISSNIINTEKGILVEYKGSLAEQFVLSELLSYNFENVFYYTDETSRNQIDFIIEENGYIVPIEVKSGINLKSKSLNNILLKYNIKKAKRYSLADYKMNEIIEDIPIYLIQRNI